MTIEDIFEYNKPYNEKNIKRLIEEIRKNNIVPYIGAGMSMLFGNIYPSWNGFLEDTFNKFCPDRDKSKFEALTYEEKADELYSEMGRQDFSQHLKAVFGKHHLDGMKIEDFDNKPVYFLPKIFDTGLLVTTNYDKVLEKVYGLCGNNLSPKQKGEKEALNNALYNRELLLYKIHGDIATPSESIVLTKKQYEEAYNGELKRVLERIYQSKVILFLACSLSGDRPVEIIKEIKEDGMDNYAIISCKKDDIKSRRLELSDKYSILSIIYPEGKHECLKIILEYIEYHIAKRINTDKTETEILNNRQLINYIPQPKNTFLGREKEIKEISEQLKKRNVLFLCGVGGIGKSELVKEYITSNKPN